MSRPSTSQGIGAGLPRVDGSKKLSGSARYAADHFPPNLAYAYGVFSTIAAGHVRSIDASAAKKMPGVIDVLYHGRFPTLYHTPSSMAQENKVDETRLPFEDDRVYYAGQFIALVIADTFENARNAAPHVAVDYAVDKPVATLSQAMASDTPRPDESSGHSRGDADSAWSNSEHRLDAVYTTPMETHNPMEMHASTAYWDAGTLVLYEATQGVIFSRNTMAAIFGLPPERVDVRAPFIGSGFGGKLWIWPHAVAAAAASRWVEQPVQLMVPRAQMFTTVGHRAPTHQHIRMATDSNGRLTALSHDTINATSMINTRVETAGRCTPSLYSCPNVRVTHATVRANHGTPTAMRAPGAAPGLFALESAMDEMAVQLGLDPVEFRRRNYTATDESVNKPFSSIHLLDAYQQGADRFGWARRNPEPGSMRDGRDILGWGVAACNWDAHKSACESRVALRSDGRVRVACATQDIGTGTYTVIAQAVADTLSMSVDRIDVEIGDSSFASGPLSGGSWTTAAVLPSVTEAARQAADELRRYATDDDGLFADASPKDLQFENGQLRHDNGRSVSVSKILAKRRLASADGTAKSQGNSNEAYAYHSFGAHFVEVRWDPGISRLRVSRVVSAIDVGRIVNPLQARNQVEGAIAMGIGMALYEATEYDEDSGRPVNNDYAEYLVPTHADFPKVDVMLLDQPDTNFSEFGARGIGEIGITGLAGAVANAVYHATGRRVRDLPIRLERLMNTGERPQLDVIASPSATG